jgi:hypothetical protein
MDNATVIVDRMVPALVSRSYEGDGLMPVLFPSVTVDPKRNTFRAIIFAALSSPRVAQASHNDHGGKQNQPLSASPVIAAARGQSCGQQAN